MNLDGLWVADFSTPAGTGNGVLAINGSQVLGGDAQYFYFGDIVAIGPASVRGTLTIQHYSGPLTSVFGPDRKVTLTFDGAASGDLVMGTLKDKDRPYLTGTVKLRKVVVVGAPK